MNNKVSIVIPVYNGSKYIIETLTSCAMQKHTNIEVLVINDCSTDNSEELIKEFILTDNRFQLIDNVNNLGVVRNVNKGIDLSTGKFIIVLGHDDILLPEHITTMLQDIDEDDSLIYCNANLIDGNGKLIGTQMNEQGNQRSASELKYCLMLGNPINSCGLMFSRNAALKVGGCTVIPEFPNYGEWLFWIKLLRVGNIRYTDKIRSQYRRHQNNISNTFVDKGHQVKLFKFFLICMNYAYDSFKYDITIKQRIRARIIYLKLFVKQKVLYLFDVFL